MSVEAAVRLAPNEASLGVHHRWVRSRARRDFRIAVIEPPEYQPCRHAALFTRVVQHLVEPNMTRLEVRSGAFPVTVDLVTWPEAFVSAHTLIQTLSSLRHVADFPCFHVGIRPDDDSKNTHLFDKASLVAFSDRMAKLDQVVETDLAPFRTWLASASDGRYGVSCLFMVETRGSQPQLRVCLHPKNTASPEEISSLPDRNVTEADFTALVSLAPPDDSAGFRVNIQPLICSDYLDLPRQTHLAGPMALVTSSPERFGIDTPEHIDIVSVTTCTAHKKQEFARSLAEHSWHGKFLGGMIALADGAMFARHRFAVTVLANIRTLEGHSAGLSGVFVPLPLPRQPKFHDLLRVWSWGRAISGEDNRWAPWRPELKPEVDDVARKTKWSSLGHLAAIAPEATGPQGDTVVMSFTLTALPRARSLWDRAPALQQIEIVSLHDPSREDRKEDEEYV